jgi:hypothetical protein
VHILVAAFVGWKPPQSGAANSPDALRQAMEVLGVRRDVHAGFRDAVILDFRRLKTEAGSKRSA